MDSIENRLNQGLDFILYQLDHGNTLEGLKNGLLWFGFEQVKEWKSKFGYQFHVYSNEHFINKKPHFHIIHKGESIDCRLFLDGELIDCKGQSKLNKKVHEAIKYFVSQPKRATMLAKFWNSKNPDLLVPVG
ncbi:MAG: Uncharacterised protein [Bacteroidota bacterium]|nr:MAG: Uncharacterised protein [Bacteroidota bacterium]